MLSGKPNPPESSITFVDIPYLPFKVSLDDIKEEQGQLRILSEKKCQRILRKLQSLKETGPKRYSKKELAELDLPAKYSIAVCTSNSITKYYALYKGYKKKCELGYGTQGVVKLAWDLETHEWLAVKIISSIYEKPQANSRKATSEIVFLGDNEHHLLKKTAQDRGALTRISPTKGFQYHSFMPLAKGQELFVYNTHQGLSTIEWLHIATEMCKAVQTLHEKYQVLHLDIKCENFNYDPIQRKLRLIDLGSAYEMQPNQPITIPDRRGTAGLVAPEVLTDCRYSTKADVYSLGVSIAETFNMGIYLKNSPQFILLNRTTPNKQIPNPRIYQELHQYFTEQVLAKNPEQRPEASAMRSFFKALQQKLLLPTERSTDLGILNVNYYVKSSIEDKKNLLTALNVIKRVQLVDHKHRGAKYYAKLLRELEKLDLIVTSQILICSNINECIAQVPQKYSGGTKNMITRYTYISLPSVTLPPLPSEIHVLQATHANKTRYQQALATSLAQTFLSPDECQHFIAILQAEANETHQPNQTCIKQILKLLQLRDSHTQPLSYEDVYAILLEAQQHVKFKHLTLNFFRPVVTIASPTPLHQQSKTI